MIQELKCNERYWPDYKSGLKNNSMRKNDRNFAVGDICILRLWQDDRFILGETVVRKITHVLHSYDFAPLKDGYCIISLTEV